jgi:SAM-dependent methyltransferase
VLVGDVDGVIEGIPFHRSAVGLADELHEPAPREADGRGGIGGVHDPLLADRPVHVVRADAGRQPFADASVDRVLTNPPWRRTVDARGSLHAGTHRLYDEFARILGTGGRAVVLVVDRDANADAATAAGFRAESALRVSVSGTWAEALVLERLG